MTKKAAPETHYKSILKFGGHICGLDHSGSQPFISVLTFLRTDTEHAGDWHHCWGGHGGAIAGRERDRRAAVLLPNETREDGNSLLRRQSGLTIGQEEREKMAERNADGC